MILLALLLAAGDPGAGPAPGPERPPPSSLGDFLRSLGEPVPSA